MKNRTRELWPLAIMVASAAAMTAIGVDRALIDAAFEATPGEWLGFVGSIIGGAMTIVAGFVALRVVEREKAVREEEKRESHRDAVSALMLAIDFDANLFRIAQEAITDALESTKDFESIEYSARFSVVYSVIEACLHAHSREDL